ncbi:hypothetical protein AVME950_12935 [Acidovorax sp. SUPP950]|nr:hypothetical protein AVME950_12935 [Acidovorax sp. SUPP950]
MHVANAQHARAEAVGRGFETQPRSRTGLAKQGENDFSGQRISKFPGKPPNVVDIGKQRLDFAARKVFDGYQVF